MPADRGRTGKTVCFPCKNILCLSGLSSLFRVRSTQVWVLQGRRRKEEEGEEWSQHQGDSRERGGGEGILAADEREKGRVFERGGKRGVSVQPGSDTAKRKRGATKESGIIQKEKGGDGLCFRCQKLKFLPNTVFPAIIWRHLFFRPLGVLKFLPLSDIFLPVWPVSHPMSLLAVFPSPEEENRTSKEEIYLYGSDATFTKNNLVQKPFSKSPLYALCLRHDTNLTHFLRETFIR